MYFLRLAPLATLLAVASTASAGILFTENFNGATPASTYTTSTGNPITGAGMRVSAGTVDVVGNLNGSFFTCNGEANNNCVDLVGSGLGTIQSTSTFNLVLGNTYTATFRSAASGAFSSFTFNSRISLGSQLLDFSDTQTNPSTYDWTNRTFQFVAAANETGVRLSIESLTSNGGGQNGALVDDIVLTETAAASGVPEPSTAILGSAGLLGLLSIRRLLRR